MDVYLVRHGEAASSWTQSDDPGLSESGISQANEAARILYQRISPDYALLSSPLRRAMETGKPLADRMGSGISVVPAFREIATPVPLIERQEWLQGAQDQPWDALPELVTRWRTDLLEQLYAVQQPTVIFTHFMALNAIVGHFRGSKKLIYFLPGNASITHLRRVGPDFDIVELGHQIETKVN